MIPLWPFFLHAQHGLEPSAGGGDIFGFFMQMLLVLALFFLILYMGSRFFKPAKSLGLKMGKRASQLDIVEMRHLGGRQYLFVVAYKNERLLLSSGPNGLQFLCRLAPMEQENSSGSCEKISKKD